MAIPTGERKYNIQHMWDKHHNIVRLIVLGKNNQEIADIIGCTPQNISDIRNSPLVQSKIAILRQRMDGMTIDVAKRIEDMAPKCTELLERIIDGEENASIALRAKTAMDLLGIAGHSPVKKVQGEIKNTTLSPDELLALQQRGKMIKELAAKDGLLVNADYVVTSQRALPEKHIQEREAI